MAVLWTSNSNAANENGVRILLFGDSLIAGYGVLEENTIPTQMQKYYDGKDINIEVIDAGVSGDTTSGGRTRFEWTVNKQAPDMIFISLGGNDLLRGIPPQVIEENIEFMLKTAKQKNIPVVISQTKAPENITGQYSKDFNKVFIDLPKKYSAATYPFLLNVLTDKESQMQNDGIHPNLDGVKVIVEDFAPYLYQIATEKGLFDQENSQ